MEIVTFRRVSFYDEKSECHWWNKVPNGEKIHRTWVCLTPRMNIPASVISCTITAILIRYKFYNENGFTTWHKLSPWCQDHKNSPVYSCMFPAWKELEHGLNKDGLIDDHFQQQTAKKWISGMYHCDSWNLSSREFDPSWVTSQRY
jgi:hypothetical protein